MTKDYTEHIVRTYSKHYTTRWFLKISNQLLLDREDGPAVVNEETGYRAWYKNGKRHRINNPAIIDPKRGFMAWYENGELHKINGPAIKFCDNTKFFYLYGEKLEYKFYLEKLINLGFKINKKQILEDKTVYKFFEFIKNTRG